MQTTQNRRRVLAALAATGVAAFIRPPQSEAQEGRLETTTVRIGKIAGICIAPQYLAEELLRAEGFTDVRYVTTVPGAPAARALAHGDIDFTTNFSVKWMHKDIGLMLDSAAELEVPLPLTALTRQMFQAAIATGHGEEDICSTIKVLEGLSGVEVKAKAKP